MYVYYRLFISLLEIEVDYEVFSLTRNFSVQKLDWESQFDRSSSSRDWWTPSQHSVRLLFGLKYKDYCHHVLDSPQHLQSSRSLWNTCITRINFFTFWFPRRCLFLVVRGKRIDWLLFSDRNAAETSMTMDLPELFQMSSDSLSTFHSCKWCLDCVLRN